MSNWAWGQACQPAEGISSKTFICVTNKRNQSRCSNPNRVGVAPPTIQRFDPYFTGGGLRSMYNLWFVIWRHKMVIQSHILSFAFKAAAQV